MSGPMKYRLKTPISTQNSTARDRQFNVYPYRMPTNIFKSPKLASMYADEIIQK